MVFEFGLILSLMVLNGLFAMSEMAIVSSRKVRLQQLAESGDRGAIKAAELADQPTYFLSTVQIGITMIGILSGALGEAAIAKPLQPLIARFPDLAAYAEETALAITVIVITYLSLLIGELVPKRLALQRPEIIAKRISLPMHWLSRLTLPAVKFLSLSTEAILWLLRAKPNTQPSITEEEIKLLFTQGTEEGVFEEAEQKFVENILRLDDRKVGAIMTPRKDLVCLDLQKGYEENRQRILDHHHWILPICDNGLDNVIGFIKTKD